MCAFDTTDEDVDDLLVALATALREEPDAG